MNTKQTTQHPTKQPPEFQPESLMTWENLSVGLILIFLSGGLALAHDYAPAFSAYK